MNSNSHWLDESLPMQIYCAPGLLASLENIAVDALLAMPRTGLGAGGLLLGKQEIGRIDILSTAEISCSHAFGPAFALTPDEIAASAELVAEGSELVGWYCSRPASKANSPIAVQHDQALFDALCPEPWQVMLLIRPSLGKPTTAAFGLRSPGDCGNALIMGTLQELPHQELAAFQESAPPPQAAVPTEPEEEPAEVKVKSASLVTPIAMPQAKTSKPRHGRRTPTIPLIATISLVLLSAAAFIAFSYWLGTR